MTRSMYVHFSSERHKQTWKRYPAGRVRIRVTDVVRLMKIAAYRKTGNQTQLVARSDRKSLRAWNLLKEMLHSVIIFRAAPGGNSPLCAKTNFISDIFQAAFPSLYSKQKKVKRLSFYTRDRTLSHVQTEC